MQEASGLAFSGIGLALLGYAAFNYFGLGGEIGGRTIEASNWSQTCESTIVETARAQTPPRRQTPRVDVCRLVFGHQGRRGEEYCNRHGGFWNSPLTNVTEGLEAQARALEHHRIEQATANAADRCACAASQVLADEKLSFAIYSGSARILTPQPIQNLQTELRVALSSPYCAMEG